MIPLEVFNFRHRVWDYRNFVLQGPMSYLGFQDSLQPSYRKPSHSRARRTSCSINVTLIWILTLSLS
jgi:hypothetical protein